MQAARSNGVLRIEGCSCTAGGLHASSRNRETAVFGQGAAAVAPPVPFSQIQFQGGVECPGQEHPAHPLWEYFSNHTEGPLVNKWCAIFLRLRAVRCPLSCPRLRQASSSASDMAMLRQQHRAIPQILLSCALRMLHRPC